MQKDNKTLLADLGIEVHKINTDGKTLCPKCSHTRKKKNDPCLSVNVVLGKYNCWNDTCDFKGVVGNGTFEKIEKTYVRPVFKNTTQLGNDLVHYFAINRKISQKTLNLCGVTESRTADGTDWINFNYFRNRELINIKYRSVYKKFRLEKDAELIFYGLDDIKDSDWCIIVEGEIDKLSFAEAGIMEVVSVPNGASNSVKANLEYLDNCIDYFKNKKKIIIATDADEAGMVLRDELARRLGYDICFKVDFKGYKDTNDLLVGESANSLKELITEANLIEFPINGIITANDIWENVEFLQKEGLKRGALTKFIPELDEFVSYVEGQTKVLTGIPNHGKSPFDLMVMASLSVNAGWKWALFTPEHKPLEIFVVKLCELLLGRRMSKEYPMSTTESALVKKFINDHFFFVEPDDEDYTLDNILSKVLDLVKRKGINGFALDPWNKVEHMIQKGDNETTYISKELDKIIRFGQRNKVFCSIIAHPTKIKKIFKSSLFEVPTLYDISGSSNWFNKPDIGITFYRNFSTGNSEVYIQKMKYEHLGKQGLVLLRYNPKNGRFNGASAEPDNSNWLLGKPHQIEININQTAEELPF